MASYPLKHLAEHIGATVHGDENALISSISTLQKAQQGQLSFLSNKSYRSQLGDTKATAVILAQEDLEFCPCNALVMDNSYVGFARAVQLLDTTPRCAEGIAPSAVIADDAQIGESVSVGANAVIESGAVLEDGVEIGAGCFVGKNAKLGKESKLWANVTIYHNCELGQRCLIQSGAVIGGDGFGYANENGKWIKIPQLGRVVIGDDVEIGANTCIDRGALDDTIIHSDVILDNHIQVAHNCEIGQGTAIAGCTVLAGSVRIGRYCAIGGASVINGHMEIADKTTITGFSMVMRPVTEPGTVVSSGMPATSNKEWRKNAVQLRTIDKLYERVRALEKAHKEST